MQHEPAAYRKLRQALQMEPHSTLDVREEEPRPAVARPRPIMTVVDRVDLSLDVYRLLRVT